MNPWTNNQRIYLLTPQNSITVHTGIILYYMTFCMAIHHKALSGGINMITEILFQVYFDEKTLYVSVY